MRLERLDRDKPSSLLRIFVNYGRKKYNNIRHQEWNKNFEEEESAHQEGVEHRHQGPDALRVEAVDAGLEQNTNAKL